MSAHIIRVPAVLDEPRLDALKVALWCAAEDVEARVWVLRAEPGEGEEPVFCRGMDLASVVASEARSLGLRVYTEVLSALRSAPRPTMALVDGDALGGGLGLAAACDEVLATPRARFGLPEGLFGIMPAMVTPVLRERLSVRTIRALAFECAARDASWAVAHGLADEVVEPEQIEARIKTRARALSRVSTGSVRALRAWIDESGGMPSEAAVARGAERLAALLEEPETMRALRAFVDEGALPWP